MVGALICATAVWTPRPAKVLAKILGAGLAQLMVAWQCVRLEKRMVFIDYVHAEK